MRGQRGPKSGPKTRPTPPPPGRGIITTKTGEKVSKKRLREGKLLEESSPEGPGTEGQPPERRIPFGPIKGQQGEKPTKTSSTHPYPGEKDIHHSFSREKDIWGGGKYRRKHKNKTITFPSLLKFDHHSLQQRNAQKAGEKKEISTREEGHQTKKQRIRWKLSERRKRWVERKSLSYRSVSTRSSREER